MSQPATPAAPAATPAAPQQPQTPPQATEPNKPDTGGQTTDIDLSKLSDEQFAKVFEDKRLWEHSRFKELNEAAKEAKALKEAQAKAEEDKLKEQGKYKELLEQREKELSDWKSAAEKAAVDSKLATLLASAGVVDADAALVLLDRSAIKHENGKVEGAEQAIEALKQSKPYLFGTPQPPKIGAGSNPQPGQQGGTKTFYRSQLSDPKFFQDNKDDIMAAYANGTIVDDVSVKKV